MLGRRKAQSRKRAVILLLTVWIIIVLGLLAQSLSFEMRVESKLVGLNRDRFVVEQLARLGVAKATTDLRNDNLLTGAEGMNWQSRFDAYGDIWAEGTLLPREFEVAPLAESDPIGSYRLLVVDEESKLNINNPNIMDAIKYLIVLLDVEEDKAERIAQAIWDWKDNDDQPVGKQGTSEIEYYAQLLEVDMDDPESRIFLPKNAPFDTLEELLGIPGMTPELFYGYDPDTEETRFFPGHAAESGEERRLGLRDLLTVKAEKFNINTAHHECLAALFGQAAANLDAGSSIAKQIIDKRQGNRSEDIDNSGAFKKINELGALPGMAAYIGKAGQLTGLTTQSDFFTIYCEARLGKEESRVRGSASREARTNPKPTARIIAGCYRSAVNYTGDGLEDWTPPGFVTQSVKREDGTVVSSWNIPVVYYNAWNTF
jgi:type II secretory pathway component PulK